MKTALGLLLLTAALAAFVFAQGPIAPPAAPGPTMKSLQDVWDKLGVLEAQNQSQLEAHAPRRRFNIYAETYDAPVSGADCTSVPIPADEIIRLESVVATTYLDPSASAYAKFFVKTSAGGGRVLAQRIALAATGNDPVSNTRSGILEIPIRLVGGAFAQVPIGEAYSLEVCVQSSGGAHADAGFIITGTYE